MKNFTNYMVAVIVIIGFGSAANAQCPGGQMGVTVDVVTDTWGYEAYWEVTPTGSACGTGTIGAFGNFGVVGCLGGGLQTAAGTDPGAYANNTTITENVGCLDIGSCFDIHFVDDYGDGGTTFQVYLDGVATDFFTGAGTGNVFNFCVTAPAAFDAAISNPDDEYTLVPLTQVTTLGANGLITNTGSSAVTDANMTVNVYNGLMANVYTGTSNTVPSILVGASSPVAALGYTPTLIDVYTVEMISNIAELDGDITNDTVYSTYAVTDSTYARDNGVITALLGLTGFGNTGVIGQNFDVVAMDTMTTVSFFIAPGTAALGDSVSISIYDVVAGTPTTPIGGSDIYFLTPADTVAGGTFLTLPVTNLASNSLILGAGTYYAAVNEFSTIDNIAIALTDDSYTPNTAWISIDGGAFITSESVGFPGAYVIRPNFGPYVCSPTGSTVLDAACNTYTWAQNGSTYTASGMYNDTLVNAEGCDSIVTLDLTINGPTTSTQTEASCSDYVWIVDGQTYIMTGMYTAVIPNAAGCDSTITLDLTIGMLDISTTVNGSTITSNAGGSATYQWVDCDNGNAPIAGATNQSYTATVSGNYAVVIVDGTCNAASVCEPVCVGTASNATEAACFSYVWALDGNTYTTTGQYTAVLANAAGCDSTVTLDLTINTVDNTTSVAGNTFTANFAGGTYLWIDCVTNNTIATETNQSFTPTTPGDYAVIVSDGTCSDTSDCVTSAVGLNENTLSKGFEIFPNPTKGAFTIAISGIITDKVTVIITEAKGKVIMTQDFTNVSESMELPVHLNSMEVGVYFVTITANDSKSVQRIVVTK